MSHNSKFLNSEERLFGTDGIRGRVNEDKINSWNSDDLSQLPVYEPKLRELIKKNRNS